MAESDLSKSVRGLKDNFGFDQNLTETERRQLRAVEEREIAPRRQAISKIYQEITEDAEKRELAHLRSQREVLAIQEANKKAADAKRDAEYKKELFKQYDQFVDFNDGMGTRSNAPYTQAEFEADELAIEESVRKGNITPEAAAHQLATLANSNFTTREATVQEQRRDYDVLRRSFNSPETQYRLRTINDTGVNDMFKNIFSDIEKGITKVDTRSKRNVAVNKRVQDIINHSPHPTDSQKKALRKTSELYKVGTLSEEQLENILGPQEARLKQERNNIKYKRKEIDDFLDLVENPVGLKDTGDEFRGATLAEAREGYDPHYVQRVILTRFEFYPPEEIRRNDKGELEGNLTKPANEAELRRQFGLNKEALEVLLNAQWLADPDYPSAKFYVRVPNNAEGEPLFESKEDSPEAKMPYDRKVNELLSAVERAAIQEQRKTDQEADRLGADTLQSGGVDAAGRAAVSGLGYGE